MEKLNWGRAILAGVVGTILFNIVMYIDIAVTGVPADIPALLGTKLIGEGSGALFVGHLVHLLNGIVLAIIFFAMSPHMPGRNNIIKGVLFAIAELIAGVWLFMLPIMGAGIMGLGLAKAIPVITLLRHLAYGIGIGLIYRDSKKVN
ncbi:hypothetical protein O9H85_28770 [Paenibacillus filicis]|uniref:Uncharacterized protein n=1 Tax=Paenibacillus gyeongsangnamensis TaxID=3388067 RepID=A0ABT4QHI7_9BACL|nr:DUF6789 family protein [Paenibacillus filicis]MCZ8516314.1 hypothetical protein [Paenibacillus filicis]